MERFWSKVDKTDSCWNWKAGMYKDGYGKFNPKPGSVVLAHRFAYELVVGLIPKGKQLDHLCRNRACVNPEHLEVVEQETNVRRGLAGAHEFLKTHCPKGHPLIEGNLQTYELSIGKRRCRTCANMEQTEYRRKKALVIKQ